MTKINLTTLFGITPANSIAAARNVNFRSSTEVSAFNFENLNNRDSFNTNSLHTNKTRAQIEQIAKSNPKIMALLKEYNIPLKANMQALNDLKNAHLSDTRVLAAKIYSALPAELKSEVNLPALQQAAMLHDYGKVLIPEEILNKKGALTPEEKKIMQLHSIIGYELLKEQGVNEHALNLIKYHHQKPDGSGYPAVENDFEYNLETQILEAADKYSALTETRCYRSADTKENAIIAIEEDVKAGNISEEVFEALKKAL